MDKNLKLRILASLFTNNEEIIEKVNAIDTEKYHMKFHGDDKEYEWFDSVPEIAKQLDEIVITDLMFKQVEELCIDYTPLFDMIMPNWDGEGNEFDIKSLKGIEKLINLKVIGWLDFTDTEDQEALQELPSLDSIIEYAGLNDFIESSLIAKGVKC